jgi:hypothetical protein
LKIGAALNERRAQLERRRPGGRTSLWLSCDARTLEGYVTPSLPSVIA